jgi:hypothetical protein
MANIDFTDQNTLLRFAPGNRPKKKTRALSVMVVIALIVGVLLAIVFFAAQAGRPGDSEFAVGAHISRETRYQAGLARLAGERSQLFAGWQSAETAAARKKALDQAAALLFASIENDIIPLWYGTPYGFNGATALPGAGSISCGHFVTTVLRDAGLKLDRIGLAQEPSELIIQSLVARRASAGTANCPGRSSSRRSKRSRRASLSWAWTSMWAFSTSVPPAFSSSTRPCSLPTAWSGNRPPRRTHS